MGLRFRKSFRVAPGIRVNLGKKSVGVSIGGKYGGVSFNTKSGARVRASAPGTGLSYSTKIGGTGQAKSARTEYSEPQTIQVMVNAKTYLLVTLLFGWAGVHRFYRKQTGLGILYLLTLGLCGIGWVIDSCIAIYLYINSKEKRN